MLKVLNANHFRHSSQFYLADAEGRLRLPLAMFRVAELQQFVPERYNSTDELLAAGARAGDLVWIIDAHAQIRSLPNGAT